MNWLKSFIILVTQSITIDDNMKLEGPKKQVRIFIENMRQQAY